MSTLRRICMSVVVGLLCSAAFITQAATVVTWRAALVPEAVGATGTGLVELFFDVDTHDLTIYTTFSGLSAPTIASHIHCCTALGGVGTAGIAVDSPSLVGFPLGVTAGTYLHTFDLDDPLNFTPAFLTASGGTAALATARLVGALNAEKSYLNIHTTAFPGGEIRAFPALAATPASLPLLALALPLMLWAARRDQRAQFSLK